MGREYKGNYEDEEELPIQRRMATESDIRAKIDKHLDVLGEIRATKERLHELKLSEEIVDRETIEMILDHPEYHYALKLNWGLLMRLVREYERR